ncbi:hypothetical protein T4D_217 [Trichinella pseudospiralis]|uniref:Uncharacterized protein n=1 Tax=Trichinella pseudospiralis TaxID=6337 RepID=A0A0V1FRW6_TRIPS|nr:hypothetical protein T4D_217 [Trichinella pseudospiralis]
MMVESVRQCTECCCCCSLAITQQTASGKFYLPVPSEFQNRDHHTFPLSKTSSKHSVCVALKNQYNTEAAADQPQNVKKIEKGEVLLFFNADFVHG